MITTFADLYYMFRYSAHDHTHNLFQTPHVINIYIYKYYIIYIIYCKYTIIYQNHSSFDRHLPFLRSWLQMLWSPRGARHLVPRSNELWLRPGVPPGPASEVGNSWSLDSESERKWQTSLNISTILNRSYHKNRVCVFKLLKLSNGL